jgi:hypothetical protein
MPYKLADASGHGAFLNAAFGGGNVVSLSARRAFASVSGLGASQPLSRSFPTFEARTNSLS